MCPGPRNGGSEICNCLFVGNIARRGGFTQVGTIFCYNSDTFIQNCTLADNNYGIFVLQGDVEINNCILQNENYEIETPDWYWPTVNVANCLIQGFKIREGDNSTIIMLDGNIDADPCFVDPNNDDYRLWPGSPCIDTGDPNYEPEPNETDLDGRPRVLHGRIDMGAYEFQKPPDCSGAYPSIGEIWPSNHKWVEVEILGVTDPDGDPIVITITGITQDEPVVGQGSGHTCPDGNGIGTSFARVRAERSGQGNGRVYEISFEAHDGSGGVCNGTVQVCVSHDKGKGNGCVDDGQIYDSTASELLSADLNRDGSIGYLDLVTLTEHWLKDEPSADIAPTDGDNIVNFMDWAVLTRYWLTSYELDY